MRWTTEGVAELKDRPMSGAPSKITKEYAEQLWVVVRWRSRSPGQPDKYSAIGAVNDQTGETVLQFQRHTVKGDCTVA